MSRFITHFHWTFLTEINLMTYLLYMFIYTYISNTNECWILKMLNISIIWYLLFTMYSFLLISLHLYYMCTLSTVLFFNYLKDMALYISIKITDKFLPKESKYPTCHWFVYWLPQKNVYKNVYRFICLIMDFCLQICLL